MPYDPSHPVFTLPHSKELAIWRYMDLSKLVSLLMNRSIFLSRADRLGDQFEGSFPRATIAARSQFYGEDEPFNEAWSTIFQKTRSSMCVNCWHMSPHESAAMWSLYTREGLGVAIRSSIQSLTQTLTEELKSNPLPVYVGQVRYVNYSTERVPDDNAYWPYVFKRQSFEHEKELRVVAQCRPNYENGETFDEESFSGLNVSVNPDTLIEDVYVAPGSGAWFRDVVQAVIGKFGCDLRVHESSLDGTPLF